MDESNPAYTKIIDYIGRNPAAVLSTVGEEGPHGAVIYVMAASHGTLCFVTKNETRKYENIVKNPTVGLTIFNEKEMSTLQASGRAFIADNTSGLKDLVMSKMEDVHATMSDWLPPVTKLANGEFVVIGIELNRVRLSDYGGQGMASPIVTQIGPSA